MGALDQGTPSLQQDPWERCQPTAGELTRSGAMPRSGGGEVSLVSQTSSGIMGTTRRTPAPVPSSTQTHSHERIGPGGEGPPKKEVSKHYKDDVLACRGQGQMLDHLHQPFPGKRIRRSRPPDPSPSFTASDSPEEESENGDFNKNFNKNPHSSPHFCAHSSLRMPVPVCDTALSLPSTGHQQKRETDQGI